MRVVAIVQARMGSTRLPGKVLEDLGGAPILLVMLRRLRSASSLSEIVVALPDDPSDDELATAVIDWGFPVVRGSKSDVLSRYLVAASTVSADILVRCTGDCPFIDPSLVDEVVATIVSRQLDYVCLGPGYPNGTECEAFSRALLQRAGREVEKESDREHVTTWMRSQNDVKRFELEPEHDDGDVRLTVD